MSQNRVIFLVDYPIDARDAERYGFSQLTEAGFTVEIWDTSAIFLPRSRGISVQRPDSYTIMYCQKVSDLETLAGELTSEDSVIVTASLSPVAIWAGRRILSHLGSSPARLTALSLGGMPATLLQSSSRARIVRRAAALLMDSDGRARLAQRVVAEGFNRVLPLLRLLGATRIRTLDQVWVDIALTNVASALIDRRTVVTYIHTLDYDLVLKMQAFPSSGLGIVFIDSMGPVHPDFEVLEIQAGISLETFRDLVMPGLHFLSTFLHKPLIVAAHPRAALGQMDSIYEGFQVVHGRTAELIAGADVVACSEGSTAVGIAVALGKPLVLLPSRKFPDFIRRINDALITDLNPAVIDLDDAPRLSGSLTPDLQAYANYVATYMKCPSTTQEPFWAQVSSDLRLAVDPPLRSGTESIDECSG